MVDTTREFWHMILDRKCNVVVMLADIQAEGTEVCAQYWPHQVNSTQHFKEITVTTESEEVNKGYIERIISILETKVLLDNIPVCMVFHWITLNLSCCNYNI